MTQIASATGLRTEAGATGLVAQATSPGMASPIMADGPRIYYLHPLLAGPLATWNAHFARAAALGFNHVLVAPPFAPARHGSVMLTARHDQLHPALDWAGAALDGLSAMAAMAEGHGLRLLLDVVLDRVAAGGMLTRLPDGPFTMVEETLDPRRFDADGDAAHAAADESGLAGFWIERLTGWASAGVAGVRLMPLAAVSAACLRALADGLHGTGLTLLGWMPGVPVARLPSFEGAGLDYVFSSQPWWDGQADWFWRETAALRRIAPVIGASEAPFGPRLSETLHGAARHAAIERGLAAAACLSAGWMLVMGQEHAAVQRLHPRQDDPLLFAAAGAPGGVGSLGALGGTIAELNTQRRMRPGLSASGEMRLLSGPGADVLAVARLQTPDSRIAGGGVLVALNMRLDAPVHVMPGPLQSAIGGYHVLEPQTPSELVLPIGGHAAFGLTWEEPALRGNPALATEAKQAARQPRIAIEGVTPMVDEGRFAARFCLGDVVAVQADVICDGHDQLAAVVRWREPGHTDGPWHSAPMRPLGNDRWEGSFPLGKLGVHHFTVEAWKDVFATYRDELSKKVAAGIDVALEVQEGRLLLERAQANAGDRLETVRAIVAALTRATVADGVALLLDPQTAALMQAIDPRAFATRVEPGFPLEAERTAARFASWYEVFPRSMSDSVERHGTFNDVIRHLPRIRAMGFDVLYFPPIHPIGQVNRKGRNNTLEAGADDPGSPYGIADHCAIHAELGDFDSFARLRQAALAEGLEIALDFAIQCAPDHPWLREHKGWFDWRPDGSIRYAENPPKKYQDIVNVDFYTDAAVDGLWQKLCEVVLFWCEQGVRIFRVDNPHTKPLPFWHWMITEVRRQHPDTLFLAEAFTKPKMMNRLAKVGFSQSYTYFTWRETRAELQAYLTELTTTEARDYFRPNFFVNTPDINPVFLQRSGRAGHLIRAALAATLAGLWGVYSGFELCEATPLPGREEYADSEKYQLRAWDWQRPGNIVREVTQLNWMRKLNPALQTHLGVTFLECGNEQIICFEKATADRSNVVVVAINLDPFTEQEAVFQVPLWRWALPDHGSLVVDDLVFEARMTWHGKMQHVRLNPDTNPYAVWRVRPI